VKFGDMEFLEVIDSGDTRDFRSKFCLSDEMIKSLKQIEHFFVNFDVSVQKGFDPLLAGTLVQFCSKLKTSMHHYAANKGRAKTEFTQLDRIK
jgi:hypothetical protein